MNRARSSSKKLPLILAVLLALVIGGGIYMYYHNRNKANLVNNKSATAVKGSTSKPVQHQLPSSSSVSPGQSGGAVDKNGQSSGSLPPSSMWVSSNSGNITLQQPSPNTVVKSGDSLTGLAKTNTVRFLLSDNSVGLIAQGNLNVVNGKFSGILQFTPHSNSGKLEVYYPDPANGAEKDIVEINVNFSAQ